MTKTILKFSSEDCGTCHRMSNYDEKVSTEIGLAFISVKMQDTQVYRKYRHILMKQYPTKEGMGWPTYLIVDSLETEFSILGEIKGGMPKGDFRSKLKNLLDM